MGKHFAFTLSVLGLLVALASMAFGQHLYAKQEQQKRAARDQLVAEYYQFKNDLEECQNKTKDKEVKFLTFEVLLDHAVTQSVPREKLEKTLKTCQDSLT